jgi:hypothetical protein
LSPSSSLLPLPRQPHIPWKLYFTCSIFYLRCCYHHHHHHHYHHNWMSLSLNPTLSGIQNSFPYCTQPYPIPSVAMLTTFKLL